MRVYSQSTCPMVLRVLREVLVEVRHLRERESKGNRKEAKAGNKRRSTQIVCSS
jgi:hypothetical protein